MSTAYVLIRCQDLHENYVIEQLKKINVIKDIQGVHGVYDIIIKVKSKNIEIINETISAHIQKIDKLKSTLTLMVSNLNGEYL